MSLFSREPIWRQDTRYDSKKSKKVVAYVKNKVKDDQTLLQILAEAPDQSVKEAALEKLSDGNLIDSALYFSITDRLVRQKIIEKTHNQQLLLEIALKDSDKAWNPREGDKRRAAAVKKLTDSTVVERFLDDPDYTVRVTALEKTTSPEAIVHFYLSGESSGIEEKKLALLSDRELLTLGLSPKTDQFVKYKICRIRGHIRGEKCTCRICGNREHRFDSRDICTCCGARILPYRADLFEVRGVDKKRLVYGYQDTTKIVYPDGSEELDMIPSRRGERVITDYELERSLFCGFDDP